MAKPFFPRRPLRRAAYRVRRRLAREGERGPGTGPFRYRFEEGKVVFRCPCCMQLMQLPVRRRGTATCPSCRTAMPFAS